MKIRVVGTDLHLLNMHTRIPFRYGIATLTAAPHMFVRVELDVDGQRHVGIASDGLIPKWFTKNPETTFPHDIAEMMKVIETACDIARGAGPADSVFALWQHIYGGQAAWGGGWGLPPLLAHFGTSLVERAILDAFCDAAWPTTKGNPGGPTCGAIDGCQDAGPALRCYTLVDAATSTCQSTSAVFPAWCVGGEWQCSGGVPQAQCKCWVGQPCP